MRSNKHLEFVHLGTHYTKPSNPLSHGCVMFEYFEHTGIVFMVMDLRLPRGECCGKCDRLASTYTSYLDNTMPGMLITNIFYIVSL